MANIESHAQGMLVWQERRFDALLQQIRRNNPIQEEYECNYCRIGDEQAQQIADALKENNNADALKENKNAVTLSLWGNQISAAGAKAIADALKKNSKFTGLGLGRNKIGDAGAQAIANALKENSTVTECYLEDNKIGDAGAQAIAGALVENTTVTRLDLRNNDVGDKGAKAVARVLKHNSKVTNVDLRGNKKIGDAGAQALLEALKLNITIRYLGLDDNNIDDTLFKQIRKELEINVNKDGKFDGEYQQKVDAVSKEQEAEEKQESAHTNPPQQNSFTNKVTPAQCHNAAQPKNLSTQQLGGRKTINTVAGGMGVL